MSVQYDIYINICICKAHTSAASIASICVIPTTRSRSLNLASYSETITSLQHNYWPTANVKPFSLKWTQRFQENVNSWNVTSETKYKSLVSQIFIYTENLRLEKIWFFGLKSWFFTRNTSTIFAPPSARRNFFKFTPPLTWNPGSAPGMCI